MPLASIGQGAFAIACADGAATNGKASAAVQTSSRVSNLSRENLLAAEDAPLQRETQ